MRLRFVAHSETGPIRKNNQDSGYASTRLLVVADGMGGAAAGDLASAVAVDEFRRIDQQTAADDSAPVRGEQMLELLAGAVTRANDKIADLVADDPNLEGMGTTVSAHMFDGSQLGVAHIGDSRSYLFRDGELRRLTHDHSWVQSLIDEGKITEEEAASHPHRNLLLKVLNGQSSSEPDLELLEVRSGDRLLVCSDGLSGLTDDESIAKAMAQPELPEVLAELIDLAHDGGGIDNITIVLADVEDEADEPVPGAAAAAGTSAVSGAVSPDDKTADDAVVGDTTDNVTSDAADDIEDTTAIRTCSEDDPIVLGAATQRSIPAVQSRAARERANNERGQLLGDDESEPDEENERYALTSPPRWHWLRIGIWLLVIGVVLLIAALAGNAWVSTQYYVGQADGRVTIYQGLPDHLAGLPLAQVYETTPTQVVDLPRLYQQRVADGIRAADLSAARRTAEELDSAALACKAQRAQAASNLDPPPIPPSAAGAGTPDAGPPASPPQTSSMPTPSAPTGSLPLDADGSPSPGQTQLPQTDGECR